MSLIRKEFDVANVDWALQQYRREHQEKLGGRFARDVDFARARPFNAVERLMYSATTRNASFGQYTGPHSLRLATLRYLPPLRAMVGALRVNVGHGIRQWRQRRRLFPRLRGGLKARPSVPGTHTGAQSSG
jgi:hypothetical protein